MIPYRDWFDFHIVTLEGHETGGFAGWVAPGDWTNVYRAYGIIGQYRVTVTDRWIWYTVLKPSASDFELISGADMPANYRFDFRLTEDSWEAQPCTIAYVEMFIMNNPGNTWLSDKATGRYTDGLATDWDNYPINEGYAFDSLINCRPITDPPLYFSHHDVARSDIVGNPTPPPYLIETEVPSNFAASEACEARDNIFRNGIQVKIDAFKNGGWCNLADGEKITLNIFPERLKVKYFNPVANSFSRYRIPTAGGVDLVINGIGFSNDFDEINDLCGVNADTQWGTQLTVSTIKFYTTAGVLAATITTPMVEFTVDSDTQITIPAATMTAISLPAGTYHVLLSKGVLQDCANTEGYAGDWRTDSYGRMREGERFVLLVADEAADGPPEPRFKWKWKSADDEVDAFFAPIDTRGAEHLWEGRLKNLSPITREIDDRTGLFSASDTAITISNADKELSKMLSRYWLKNQLVEFYYGWGSQPEAWHEYFFRGVVDDYILSGIHFDVTIRDLTHKYFQIRAPQFICTEDDYPDIHESAIGRSMPEALGLCSLVPAMAGETAGELEAIYVDTTGPPYSYLAAHFPLNSITQVYSDNVLMATPADYTIAYRDIGRTYIDFTANQGDNKITFNCTGYSLAGWNDPTNGYIQNPAYIISFFLTQIMGMPLALLDMESFDNLATLFITNNWHQAGKLILQSERDSMEILRELLFSFGSNLWIAKDGRLTIGRKDVTNFSTDLIIFEQIHAMAHAEKQFNLNEAINWANIHWDYVPTHTLYKSAKEESSSSSIEDFGKELSPQTPWNLPWNISDDFIEQRIVEELLKAAYGYRKIKVTIPIDLIDEIDIFTNIRYQDPYGLSWTKSGDRGRYYYISSLTYDFQMQTIDMEAVDMQYILRQLFILGDEDDLSCNYSTATDDQRMYGHLADEITGRFSNGDPCKKLWDENAS